MRTSSFDGTPLSTLPGLITSLTRSNCNMVTCVSAPRQTMCLAWSPGSVFLLSSYCFVSFSWSSFASVVIYPNQVALRLVRKALDAVKRCKGKLIHPETIRSAPGCSSARLEGTGAELRCILSSLNKGAQASTRMLFSLIGRHWSVTTSGEHIFCCFIDRDRTV